MREIKREREDGLSQGCSIGVKTERREGVWEERDPERKHCGREEEEI